jgi:hypothetical protein
MLRIIRAKERHFSDFGWLKTYWLFSFSDYYDPANVQLGSLRVFNDDIVEADAGFPNHPHREMEIITIVLSGSVTHRDSLGNEATIQAGDVQRMSAGTGIMHSEFNLSTVPAHFYQVWILPSASGLPPSYDQHTYPTLARKNRLQPVATGQGFPDVVNFHADASVYMADLDAGRELHLDADPSRSIFVYVTSGQIMFDGQRLGPKDQGRVDPEGPLQLLAESDTGLVLIDVPSGRGWGYNQETLRGARGARDHH